MIGNVLIRSQTDLQLIEFCRDKRQRSCISKHESLQKRRVRESEIRWRIRYAAAHSPRDVPQNIA